VFARAPVAGQVKTRLAAGIGVAAALEFYRQTLDRTTARLASDPRWMLTLAVTPDTAAPALWPSGVERIGQGDGDLGQRMARLLALATPSAPVLIVGADIPGLEAAHVARALEALSAADLALGPARDGGYWLIGARSPPPPRLFDGVRWSTAHASADTLRNAFGLTVALADELEDVDDAEDYRRWLGRPA
jgi:rSAM/selenodomain-associated transferase 1